MGYRAELVRETLGSEYEYVEQTEQLGTGHALMTAANYLKNINGDVLVLAGDTPFLTPQILRKLIKKHQKYRNRDYLAINIKQIRNHRLNRTMKKSSHQLKIL